MNTLLWILQVLAALVYAASGVMKLFMLDEVREGVRTFDALPREVWMALGLLELVCVFGLIVPSVFRWRPKLTVAAAVVLAIESLVFIAAHAQYRETGSIVMSAALGALMAFLAYGRMVLRPLR